MGMKNLNSGNMKQGFKAFENLIDMVGSDDPEPSTDYSGDYEETARMMELDARERALAKERETDRAAKEFHANQEKERARENTGWGQSGLAMSGSKALVRDSRQLQDRQSEEDATLQGAQDVESILNSGRREANMYRVRQGVSPERSTLSLGSTIYKYGG